MRKILMLATTVGALVVAAAPMTSATSSTIDGLASPDDPAPAVRIAPPKRQEPAPPPSTTTPALSDANQRQLDLINAERARRGLAPMVYDSKLELAAQGHSQDQANRRTMTHQGADGSNTGDRIRRVGFEFRDWAENVAFGYGNVDAVMIAWMQSAGHARNILSSNTHVGFGLAYSADGLPYYTQVFATPR